MKASDFGKKVTHKRFGRYLARRESGQTFRLTPEKVQEFRQMLKKSPKLQGIEGSEWTGIKVQYPASKKRDLTISLRTAQECLVKNK